MSDSAVLTCLFSRVNGRFGAIPAFQPGAILPRVPGVQHVACESVGRVSQPRSNKPGCGGARLSGIRIVSIAGTVSSRWVSIFSRACPTKCFGYDHRIFDTGDHLNLPTVLNDRHLKPTLTRYFNYYHRWRTHLSLEMDSPESRSVQPPAVGPSLSRDSIISCENRAV
jgi:hypothetical protein